MLQSKLFTKTSKQFPKDEVSRNAQLLLRAGYIHKEMAGVYSLMPLGLKVINNIRKIVAAEMTGLGSEEIIMSTLQTKEVWQKTNRWDDQAVDVWFKTLLKNGSEVGFGWSHEEPIIELMKSYVTGYNDLPRIVHQFQNKLRNEVRAKSGIIRCREFIMKDMYAFCATEEQNMNFYNQTIEAYRRVFQQVGLGDITYVTSASGGVFTDKFSHEFQTICASGEDVIYVHKDNQLAVNQDIYNQSNVEKMGLKMADFQEHRAAEVGNIFNFGTSKCEQMGLYFNDKDGTQKPVFLSSYGIGITRLMGVVAEVYQDDRGLIWPEALAPFRVHLLTIGNDDETVKKAEELYARLSAAGQEVLFDDRVGAAAGVKFADADLLGMPYRVVVSAKTLAQNAVEVKKRADSETHLVSPEELFKIVK